MSVVIIGGHDRMVCKYKSICNNFGCKAKVFTQAESNLEGMIGTPDLIILFTNPTAHALVKIAKNAASRRGIALTQSHCGSQTSLRNILAAAVNG